MNKNKSQNAGEDFPLTDELILAAGVLLYFLYRFAFGGGIPQRERQWAIQLYSVASMALAAEASGSLSFFSFVAAELLSRDHHPLPLPLSSSPFTPFLLSLQCFLMFWKYHVLNGSRSSDEAAAATYPPIARLIAASLGRSLGLRGRAASIIQDVLAALEGGVDMLGVIAIGLGVFVTKEYVMEVREQRREAAAKGAEAAASGKKDE